MLGLIWTRQVARRPARLALSAAGIALAVALLAAIGMFLGAAKATMTARATQTVAVDWQVQARAPSDAAAVASAVAGSPGVARTATVSFADTTSFGATIGGTTQTTGAGVALGVAGDYAQLFPQTIRPLVGTTEDAVLAQQTATNLHAAPGDTVTIDIAGQPPATVTVTGVVDILSADSLFQAVGAPAGAQPQAPPDNVVLLPEAAWHQIFDPLAANRPDLVRTQVHVALTRDLPSDPAAAYVRVTGMARRLEERLAGRGTVGDNLAATLSSARADALYAQVLFLFLGLPGAVLAGLLAATVAAAGTDHRRREQALLRIRGATTSRLVRLALVEAAVVGVTGATAGLAAAALVGRLAFGTWRFGATTATALGWSAGAVAVGLVTAGLAVALPAWRDARSLTVSTARATVGRRRLPLWARLGVDGVRSSPPRPSSGRRAARVTSWCWRRKASRRSR
jgi:putative ABC transport system permease protein